MIAIPFPFIIAEFVIFWMAVSKFGFLTTMGYYLLPCLLGLFIVSTMGKVAMMTLQGSVARGQMPANKMLHSGAIFLSGILFLIPSFFTRVIGIVLFLPGLRHFAVWRLKLYMAKQIAKGTQGFSFNMGGGPFGFGTGMGGGGFRRYEYRHDGAGFQDVTEEVREEREITDVEVVDVTPLEITHEEKKKED